MTKLIAIQCKAPVNKIFKDHELDNFMVNSKEASDILAKLSHNSVQSSEIPETYSLTHPNCGHTFKVEYATTGQQATFKICTQLSKDFKNICNSLDIIPTLLSQNG